ncbi:MAG: hypothetical protein A2044_07155 [Candidatus Firestonebacteria bacterium GWA2_43_8]|nr:MAG: hypothetical protein A2044_07155 [Candidatus Firestonebacteria bacterium GWA2_43_8]
MEGCFHGIYYIMMLNLRGKVKNTLVVLGLLCLPLFVFSDTTKKMMKEGDKVFAVYYDQGGAETAREECTIPRNLQMTLTTLSYSPYYGIKSELKSGSIPDGAVKVFDEDGTLRLVETYKDGKRNGTVTSYFKSGKVSSNSFYADDKLNGKLTAYSRDGKIASEIEFIKGVIQNGNVYGMEANESMNIGEMLGRFAEKRRLSGKRILLVTDPENKDTAREIKLLFTERGAEVVTAGTVKKINEGDKGADILIAEADFQFYDIITFTCAPKSIDVNSDLGNTLRKSFNDGKVITAIGDAEAILARAGLLVSREAAKPEKETIEFELSKIQNLTFKEGVVVNDKIVTASGSKNIKDFVSETVKLFKMD